MAEAGYAEGFGIDWFTPFPAAESLSLRVMEQLREIGIKAEMNVMERPVYYQKLLEGKPDSGYGHKGFPGRQIGMAIEAHGLEAFRIIDRRGCVDEGLPPLDSGRPNSVRERRGAAERTEERSR